MSFAEDEGYNYDGYDRDDYDTGTVDTVYAYYNKLSDKQLKKAVQDLVSNKDLYTESSFTSLVKSILLHDTFSEKQRKVLVTHIVKHMENFV
jgi:hypothetical protein